MSCILFSRSSYEMLIENSELSRSILRQFEGRKELDGEFFMSWSEWLFNLNVAAYRERYRGTTDEEIEGASVDQNADYEFSEVKDWNDPKEISSLFGRIRYQCSEFSEQHPKRASVEMLCEIEDAIKAEMATPAYAAKVAASNEAKRSAHKQEVARITAELKAKYPKAKPAGKLSSVARAAANLRAELKAAFPGVKFEVKSKSYSGGNSVSVDYVDGPPLADVEAIANQYVAGDFDGMDDCYRNDKSAFGEAFEIVCGRARYVRVERDYSVEAMQLAVDVNAASWGEENAFEVKVTEYNGHAYVEYDNKRELQRRQLFELLRATDLRF